MRIFPRAALVALRQAGFDVESVAEHRAGATDEEVLSRCTAEMRTLLTFDKDFGELAFRKRLPAECGIVLFRVITPTPQKTAAIVLAAIKSRLQWAGHFSVVTEQRIRMTPLPLLPQP